jgi:translation elongation factor aEF-1 beta
MATVLITLRIMPEDVDVSLDGLLAALQQKIEAFGGKVLKTEKKPIAFGLMSLDIIFSLDEKKGSTQFLEEDIKTIPGIMNADVVDVRRAFG